MPLWDSALRSLLFSPSLLPQGKVGVAVYGVGPSFKLRGVSFLT